MRSLDEVCLDPIPSFTQGRITEKEDRVKPPMTSALKSLFWHQKSDLKPKNALVLLISIFLSTTSNSQGTATNSQRTY
jgi:hypothetical protein